MKRLRFLRRYKYTALAVVFVAAWLVLAVWMWKNAPCGFWWGKPNIPWSQPGRCM